MPYSVQHIAQVIAAPNTELVNASIAYLLIDSRKIVFPKTSLFFALAGPRRDGHTYIKEVYERGVRNFVVSKKIETATYPQANFLLVNDVLKALQTLASQHRSGFQYPVIGITGSNGKTIVKEWLYQLLQADENIVRSPRSYNSQVGVPLSVWQMQSQHTLGIFEAGISTVNQMQALANIIKPTIGILTNIGEAHSEGFANDVEKLQEKLKLFLHCQQLVYCKDVLPINTSIEAIINLGTQLFSWSKKTAATLQITSETRFQNQTEIIILFQKKSFSIIIPFTDTASIENAITCICVMLLKGITTTTIQSRILQLQPVEMRMQLKKGVNNTYILNDSYSNDLWSLSIALDYLKQQSGNTNTTVILSDILQAGIEDEKLYAMVANELQQRNIHRFIGIGTAISKYRNAFANIKQTSFYNTTDNFLQQATHHQFSNNCILLKGARVFAFERINHWLEQKVHQTIMEINLSAMVHNVKQYQQKLLPTTKLMAMVKAFSYGSGSVEVARLLQFYKVDYLAVAYADEGVDLRKAGITLPIMVMNVDEAGFDALVDYNLEPEIYSFTIYNGFQKYLLQQGIQQFPIHIKLNTGMNRLGFEVNEVETLAKQLTTQQIVVVKTVFSHLVASESAEHDGFTQQQASLFDAACAVLAQHLPYTFTKHLANSSGIFRHPNLQYNMVRLGIGLYGVDSANGAQLHLQPVATLKTTIAQIRTVKANDTVGYNTKGKVLRDSKIATIRIGYADGFNRQLGNSVGKVWLHNQLAPVIGNVCMDMAMIDVTDIANVQEGSEVEIFGKHLPIQQVAAWCNTISYEVMTTISQRVKRVYVEE
ncbi:MAG: bifunctional UDP-N-acetylmuramoyl-tripeptide:D-alanyl-D-alanine ligase/alanine racemase [Flavobacterium sp.]|nr:bifunctional UDP-N-acetylmuramoyl-tripeptide:D-alanyl-D-alanine ligase/alanine racemase [Flavobacterium sp.]